MSPTFDRRAFLGLGAAAVLAQYLGPLDALAGETGGGRLAFAARNLDQMYRALGLAKPEETTAIDINAPELAENGSNVPVEINVRLPNVDRVLLIGELNQFPLLADIAFTPRSAAWFEARIRLAESSLVRVIAQSGGKLYTASRRVQVTVGGCL